jgi:FSR family fosmidomycin resistance protein-like MFS transporter
LICLALIHALVDGFAQVVAPLWPHLEMHLGMAPWLFALTYTVWQLATSISQPVFGYWGDRFGGRWMVGLGPAVAVVCLSLVGLAREPAVMVVLLGIGGLGIGAFHPEAAVGVVEATGSYATRGLAIFTFGGMMGLGLGPLVSGTLAEKYGLPSLAWMMPPGLLLLALLMLLQRPAQHHVIAHQPGGGLADVLDGRGLAVTVLLAVATLRVVPALGIPLALAYLLAQQDMPLSTIGWTQSVFLWSGSLGVLACPLFTRPGRELSTLVGTSVAAAGCIVLLMWKHPVAYYVGLMGSGFFLQGGIPLLIAYSQRLLPRGRRLAASLTLGTSWGLGGVIVGGLKAWFDAAGRLEEMLWILVPFALGAAVGTWWLPRFTAKSAESDPVSHHVAAVETAG